MTRNGWILLATLGSLAMILGAWFFQYVIGLAPCQMCYWQRWPHIAAAVIGVIALTRFPVLAWLGAIAAATTSGLGVYHAGVEQKWWPGPQSCTGGGDGLTGLSGSDLLSTSGPSLVMCDEISWAMFGLSMPAWNAVISAVLVIFWIRAIRSPF